MLIHVICNYTGIVHKKLIETMESKPNNLLTKRGEHTMDNGQGAAEWVLIYIVLFIYIRFIWIKDFYIYYYHFRLEKNPDFLSVLPLRDIANEIQSHLTDDMAKVTPAELKVPMKGNACFSMLLFMFNFFSVSVLNS